MTIRVQPPAGNSEETTRIARLLLEAAENEPHRVHAVTDGPSVAFLVPEEVASKVLFNPETSVTDEQGDAVAPTTDEKKKTSKKGNA